MYTSKPIEFPEVTTLLQLFDSFEFDGGAVKQHKTEKIGEDWWLSYGGSVNGVGGFRVVSVTPSRELVDWIKTNMLRVQYDTISFQVTIRKDRTALVCAKYNTILGSKWLAVIDAEEMINNAQR